MPASPHLSAARPTVAFRTTAAFSAAIRNGRFTSNSGLQPERVNTNHGEDGRQRSVELPARKRPPHPAGGTGLKHFFRGMGHCADAVELKTPWPPLATFLLCSPTRPKLRAMPEPPDKLTLADPKDLADALAFALRFHGRKRVHHADEYMAAITAERLVEHLERAGFVVMKRPPIGGAAASGRGDES